MLTLHYAPDNASLIVRLALDEMHLAHETVLVDRARQQQKSAAYRALNPRGLIPVLETPQGPMFETAAILLWLSEETGTMAPAPGTGQRALFLSWLFALSNGLHADMRGVFYPELIAGDDAPGFTARTRARVCSALDLLEDLAGKDHAWFAAASPSVLDIYLAPLLRWLALYPVGGTDWFRLAAWPRLNALALRLEARPSVVRACTAEGLGPHPFSAPRLPRPPEGSAT